MVRFTGRAEGDLSDKVTGADRRARERALVDRPWVLARQVPGSRVAVVRAPGDDPGDADALVTASHAVAVAVRTADCAAVALASADAGGVVGVAHAGWRGLLAGVIEEAVKAMRGLGADQIDAAIGPSIGPECYEFGDHDLALLEDRFGPGVRGATSAGRPALDLVAGVEAALREQSVSLLASATSPCTACNRDEFWSHRASGDPQRQAGVAWLA